MKNYIIKLAYVISFFIALSVMDAFSQEEPMTQLFDVRAIYSTAPRINEILKNGDTTFFHQSFRATNIEGNIVYLIYEYYYSGMVNKFSVDTLNLDLVGGFSLDTVTSFGGSNYIKPIFKDDEVFVARSTNEFEKFGYKSKSRKWAPLPYYDYFIVTMENIDDNFYVGMRAHKDKDGSIIRKYDANLTLVNVFTYQSKIIDMIKSDDNNLMVLTKKEDGKNYIQKIDSGGVILNDFLLSDTNTLGKIYSVTNNKFVISGYTADTCATFLLIDGNGNEIIKKKHSNWYSLLSLSIFNGKYYLSGTTRNKIVAYLEFNPENSMFKTYYNSFNITGQSYECDMDDFGNMYISYFNSSRSTNVLKVNLPQPLFLNSIKNDLLNEELTISPNPATDYITININGINPTLKRGGEGDVFVGIYDIMGILVSNTPSSVFNGQTGASDLPRIDISNLSPGVYFVKIIGSNGAYSSVEKFVKY